MWIMRVDDRLCFVSYRDRVAEAAFAPSKQHIFLPLLSLLQDDKAKIDEKTHEPALLAEQRR